MKQIKSLELWFFAFWIKKYKVTYLVALMIVIFGVISLNNIPKESDPEVNLPLVQVTTVYDWVTASIIDDEITEELEAGLTDIEWISAISSTSNEWNSSINITIDDSADIDEVLIEIEDAVNSTNLPSWVDNDYPKITQRSFSSTDIFSLVLYADENEFSFEQLLDLAESVKQNTAWESWIKEVTIDTNTIYDIRIILSQEKLDSLWITLSTISSAINNNNTDSPIGTYDIDGTNYSYKLSWKIKDYNEVLNLDIFLWDSFIKLWDVADIELYYWDEKINKFGKFGDSGYLYISLTYSKLSGANVFDVAPAAKEVIAEELWRATYEWVNFQYSDDESETISEDFWELTQSAITTLIFVFIALIFFVGFRESLIATIILPLAFLLSFIIVDYMWETLNQMTSFAFVLAFWIAIDTIIIIVEWASEKAKQWYTPRTAALIALRDYKSPIIIGTITTVSAFIPILTLPWIMWIMLSFIPLVVFITLISTLFVSLTIAWAMFVWMSKNKKTYEVFEEREKVMDSEQMELLTAERKWKTQALEAAKSIREKVYWIYSWWYKRWLTTVLKNKKRRFVTSLTPIAILAVCIIYIVPSLWFELFPSWRNDSLRLTITAPEWTIPSQMEEEIMFIESSLSGAPEVKDYTLSISSNSVSASITLTPWIDRQNNWELDNDGIQTFLTNELKSELASKWYNIWARAWRRWWGTSDPVWVFVTTTNADNYSQLIELADDFKVFLEDTEFVSDVSVSASNPIWEIEFTINSKQVALLGLNEKDVFNAISTAIRGSTVGSVKWASNDHDLKLYIDTFLDNVTPSDIENITIYSGWQTIKAWSVIDYKITKNSPTIRRTDWVIQVWVSAALSDTSYTADTQASLNDFAREYNFPAWISYAKWGENEENSDLINSVLTWIFVAFFLIFIVLVYQFNSYWQPLVILFSVFMSMIGVTIGLYLTGNPLSMPVWIWFISLMWIVVNDAIVMIDKVNKNLDNWMELKLSIIEWSVSRLNPILVTTVTTVAWILPIALQDVFWAWLWFTIAFGLTTGSFMTLFAIPTLYYSLEARKYKNEQNKEFITNKLEKERRKREGIKRNYFKAIFRKKNIKYLVFVIIVIFVSIWISQVLPEKEEAPAQGQQQGWWWGRGR